MVIVKQGVYIEYSDNIMHFTLTLGQGLSMIVGFYLFSTMQSCNVIECN